MILHGIREFSILMPAAGSGSIAAVKDFDSIFPGAFITACVVALVLLVSVGKVLV